jgi:hypothetical protein
MTFFTLFIDVEGTAALMAVGKHQPNYEDAFFLTDSSAFPFILFVPSLCGS